MGGGRGRRARAAFAAPLLRIDERWAGRAGRGAQAVSSAGELLRRREEAETFRRIMLDHNKQRWVSLSRRLIAFIGVIVPRRLRARWRREWEAELEYREELLARWDRLDRRARLE